MPSALIQLCARWQPASGVAAGRELSFVPSEATRLPEQPVAACVLAAVPALIKTRHQQCHWTRTSAEVPLLSSQV